ncbi:MAG TPA: sugar phosphate nucleotidyltransferase [Candidatus Kapabacteria bacterium]|nr:sugar phosphate nucleotidyltransferase [Candidatus Kapabacteria bacterium]
MAIVVLAAGQGKRMEDPSMPKVLYPIAGEPMIGHVLHLCETLGSDRTIAIIGFGREQVTEYLGQEFPAVQIVIQNEQLGTGHAVQQAEKPLSGFSGDILILSGDVPLLSIKTVRHLLAVHHSKNALATVLAVPMENPTGYGRIVRTPGGNLDRIVEEKDATEQIREIKEINSGIYVFDAGTLFSVLRHVDRKNAQGEYYLTDTFALIIQQFGQGSVSVAVTDDPIEVSGVNTKEQLAALEAEYQRRSDAIPSQTVQASLHR